MSVSRDSGSGRYVPATAAEWNELLGGTGILAPSALYLCQESGGDLIDTIGGIGTLTAQNGPLYQQSAPGWTRKGVAGSQAANQAFLTAAGPNPSTTSVLVFMYIGTAPDAVAHGVFTTGTSPSDVGVSTYLGPPNIYRYRNGGTVRDTSDPNYTTTPEPLLFQHNVTGAAAAFQTERELINPPFGAASSGTFFGFGGINAVFAAVTLVYAAAWIGSSAEISAAQRAQLLNRLNGTEPFPEVSTDPVSLGGLMTVLLLAQPSARRDRQTIYGPKWPVLRKRK